MKVFESVREWREFRSGGFGLSSLGFVPTMGALHAGHLSLVERSRRENDLTLVSLFVNPTQFNDPEDYSSYPRTRDRDLEVLDEAGTDFVILPEGEEIYPDGYRFQVTESDLSRELCGRHRPGHFDGVLTVVLKLLNLAGAGRAYFGEKDYQQYLLIQGMTNAFFHPTEIVSVPTVREKDGLAMSSRNLLLSGEEREKAAFFPRVLFQAPSAESAAHALEKYGFVVDYVEDRGSRRFGAVRLGQVRLIDNVVLE